MEFPPVGKKDFLNRKSVFQIIYYGFILTFITLCAFLIGKYAFGLADDGLLAITFCTLSFAQMALIFCFKSSSISVFSPRLKYNP
jgi:magnesium-transporting ATPase (P-type)